MKVVEVGEERVVVVEALAEAEAGVEDELIAGDACGDCGLDAPLEAGADEGEDFVRGEWREVGPFVRAASGVHEDGSATEGGAGGGHGRVPEVAADVVDDLGSGFHGCLSRCGVEGVDGEDGAGSLFENGLDDGEDAGLLFVGGERGGVGAGGFAADVEDFSSVVEHVEGLGESAARGVVGGVEVAAVGEGVGGDVEDAHDEGAVAEGEGASAEAPVEVRAVREGHGGILCRE